LLNAFHVLHVTGLKALIICHIFAKGFSDHYETERPIYHHTVIWKTIMFYY